VIADEDRDYGLRLADLVTAFSLATDLGLGQPTEHVLRSWLIASRLADHLDVGADMRAPLYYVTTLAWAGCVADTPEVAAWFGDDIAYRRDSFAIDLAGLPLLGFSLRHIAAGSPLLYRLRRGGDLVITGGKAVERGLLSHCLTTVRMAERLGLGENVCVPLRQVFTRWDARGVPGGVGGEQIAPLMACSTWRTSSGCTTEPAGCTPRWRSHGPGGVGSSTPRWWTRSARSPVMCSTAWTRPGSGIR